RPVENMYAGAPVPAYNGPRFGFRRPAELEGGGPQLPAMPAGSFADQGGARGGPGRRADHDRRRGARPERGPAGRALRRRGWQAAGPVASRYRSLTGRRLHHEHPQVPAAWQPGSAAGRGGGLLTVSRTATPV